MTTYYCTIKQGRKRIGLAAWTPRDGGNQTCLAQAERVFSEHGFKGDTSWGQVTHYKNWAGMKPGAPIFTETEQEADRIGEYQRARDYRRMGSDWEDYQTGQEPEYVTQAEYEAMAA